MKKLKKVSEDTPVCSEEGSVALVILFQKLTETSKAQMFFVPIVIKNISMQAKENEMQWRELD